MNNLYDFGGGNFMANPLEVYFDYSCPYCYRAHEYLKELLPNYPQLEIAWRPCEAHPRPDPYGLHSDLCIQGLFFILENGICPWTYHDLIYQAIYQDHIDIEDLDILAEYVCKLLGADNFKKDLQSGKYISQIAEANWYAWEKLNLSAVPSYRMGDRKLDSVENIGVTKKQIKQMICEGLITNNELY